MIEKIEKEAAEKSEEPMDVDSPSSEQKQQAENGPKPDGQSPETPEAMEQEVKAMSFYFHVRKFIF